MRTGEAGRVGASFLSGCWDLGLRRRERREMIGKERQEQLRTKKPHRQVVSVLCMVVLLKMSTETFTYFLSDNMFYSVCVAVIIFKLSDYIITYLKCAITSSTPCG